MEEEQQIKARQCHITGLLPELTSGIRKADITANPVKTYLSPALRFDGNTFLTRWGVNNQGERLDKECKAYATPILDNHLQFKVEIA